ncbi:MAG: hypothetical protein P8P40_14050 [Sulfitobacter sp.]|nr:hypothetical protein [Sulfitobacter sp.]MDG1353009.1 hypothetical protein [Sulfitobacter sp.]
MKQIITGPFGRVAYHNAAQSGAAQYPSLNMPCRDFARGEALVAANDAGVSNVVHPARAQHSRAATARYGIFANN